MNKCANKLVITDLPKFIGQELLVKKTLSIKI